MNSIRLRPEQIDSIEGRLGRFGDDLHQSQSRENYLGKVSKMMTPRGVEVTTKLSERAVSYPHPTNEGYVIEVPSEPRDQPVTSYRNDVWNLLFQETILFHELGHLLWTDFDSFGDLKEKADHSKLFKNLWNAAEDGVMEIYLSRQFNIRDDLFVLNSNLTEDFDANNFGFADLVSMGLIDRGFFNTGVWDQVMEEEVDVEHQDQLRSLDPQLKALMTDLKHTPDPTERNQKVYDFYTDLVEWADEKDISLVPGSPQPNTGEEMEESEGQEIEQSPEMPQEEGDQESEQQSGMGEGDLQRVMEVLKDRDPEELEVQI